MIENYAHKILLYICEEAGGFFEKGRAYYCFADEGYDFWIHAPWLEKTLGVTQIKVTGTSRENFIIKESPRAGRPALLPG